VVRGGTQRQPSRRLCDFVDGRTVTNPTDAIRGTPLSMVDLSAHVRRDICSVDVVMRKAAIESEMEIVAGFIYRRLSLS
jgi:hypothetical protein